MNKLKKILLLSLIGFSTINISDNNSDFFYKSKSENNNIIIYNNVVNKNIMVEEIVLSKNENNKDLTFSGLQNKENMKIKYEGRVNINKSENSNNIEMSFSSEDKTKKINLFLNTKDKEEVFFQKLLENNYRELFKYLSKNNFELKLKNKNDTSYLFSLLNLDDKNSVLKDLINSNSNNITENLKIFSQGGKIRLDNYKMEIENIMSLEMEGYFLINENNIIIENFKIETNVKKYIESFNEFEKLFNISLKEGKNNKEIKKLEIKL